VKITSSFQRFYFGAVLQDIRNSVNTLRWEGLKLDIRHMSIDELHSLFKIITYFDKSLKDMDSKEVSEYIEHIRAIVADSGHTLKVDEQEWERILLQMKG